MTNIRTKIIYAVGGLVFATALPIAYAATTGQDIHPNQIATRHIQDGAVTAAKFGAGLVPPAADALDYTEMKDALTLDAATSLTCPGAFSYTDTMSGTGNRVINLSSTADFVVQDNGTPAFTVNDSGNVTLAGSQTNSALGLGLVHASAAGLFSSSTLATGDIASGAVTAPKLQSAAADLGAADVTVNLGNTNGAFNTNVTTDGTVTATGGFAGNATTATALAANPADCAANQFATTIAASGALTCAAIADADVPDGITVTLAGTATALAADPADCGANSFATTIAASGALTCAAIADADVPNTITIDNATAAGTATALAADPADCGANTFAQSIAASGALTCAAIADADVPDGITVTLAGTATALAADPADCGAGTVARSIAASGALTCSGVVTADIAANNVTGVELAHTLTWDENASIALNAGPATTVGRDFSVVASAGIVNDKGGDAYVTAGAAPGNGAGGKVILAPGTSASGTAGYVDIGGTGALGATLDPVAYGYFTNLNAQDLVVMAPNTATTGTLADVNWGVATTQTGALNGFHVDASNLTVDAISQYNGFKVSDPANVAAGTAYGVYVAGTNWDYGLYSDDDVYIGGSLTCTSCVNATGLAADAAGASEHPNGLCLHPVSVTYNPTETGATDDYVSLSAVDVATGNAMFSATETNVDQFRTSQAGYVSQLAVLVDVAPGVGNDAWTITVRSALGATTLTCAIDEAVTTCTDLSNSPSVGADSFDVQVTSSVGGGADPTAAAEMTISFCFTK